MTPTEEVHQAETAFRAALNQGDVSTIMRLNYPGGNSFYLDNNLLMPDLDQQTWEQIFAAGLKFDMRIRYEEIKIFGESAVVTGYLVGSVTNPEVRTQTGTWRYTGVWFKTDQGWQYYHAHLSPLAPAHTSS
jgi:ketosteroid isomerase-like protein